MKGVHLDTDTSQYPTEMIKVDQLQVKKILLNLISNAIKYTPAGGTVKVKIQALQGNQQGYTRRLIVEDTGIGMSQEFIGRMYEPFSQELRPEAKDVIGTGLGLSIVKRVVDFMGGTITVESKRNRGTCFTVDLPIEHWAKKPADIAKKQAENKLLEKAALAKLRNKRVLLCEDNYLNAEIASIILKDIKMSVDWVKDGKQCVTAYAKSAPDYYDIILMDIRMPVMDGYTATKSIRQMSRSDAEMVPIIAMSANAFEEDMQEAEVVGMNDYVTKPINPTVLFTTLAKYSK
jgi:CheY-like chemotaxis protein